MPEGYYRRVNYPDPREHWLDVAARAGELIVCNCRSCKRTVRYLASDLLPILGPSHRVATEPPFPCRCGEHELISVKCETPSAGDWGHLYVRRPAGIRQTQTWKTVRLGDELQNTVQALPDRTEWLVPKGQKRKPRGL